MISSDDETILAKSDSEHRILITDDKDFGELIFRLRKLTTGVVFLRLEETDSKVRYEILAAIMKSPARRQFHNCAEK